MRKINIILLTFLSADDKPGMEDVTLLGTITVFIVCAPKPVANIPSLKAQCVEVFKDTWDSDSSEVSYYKIYKSSLSSTHTHIQSYACTYYLLICIRRSSIFNLQISLLKLKHMNT